MSRLRILCINARAVIKRLIFLKVAFTRNSCQFRLCYDSLHVFIFVKMGYFNVVIIMCSKLTRNFTVQIFKIQTTSVQARTWENLTDLYTPLYVAVRHLLCAVGYVKFSVHNKVPIIALRCIHKYVVNHTYNLFLV